MKKKMYKICIVGAGWYGCHLGYKLSKSGHNVSIFEKNTDIFQGSSGFNQFRLHTGYLILDRARSMKLNKTLKISERIQNLSSSPKKYLLHCQEKSLMTLKHKHSKGAKLNSKKQKINFLQNIN